MLSAHTPDKPVWTALRASLPAFFGYLPIGFAFGLMFERSGLGPWYAGPLMSLFVYAGAAQFVALSMLLAGGTLVELAASTLILNLRHVFYGLPFVGKLPGQRWKALYFIFGLTDETYAILTNEPALQTPQVMSWVTFMTHGYWVGGTLLGAWAGQALPWKLDFLQFSLVAMFVVLAVEQAKRVRQWTPFCEGPRGTDGGLKLLFVHIVPVGQVRRAQGVHAVLEGSGEHAGAVGLPARRIKPRRAPAGDTPRKPAAARAP